MKMVKKLIAILAVAVMSLSVVGCGSTTNTTTVDAATDETIIATVDGTPIYRADFDAEMGYVDYMMLYAYGEDYKENEEAMAYYETQKQDVLQYLIESQVLLEKAKQLKIAPTDKQVEEELKNLKSQYGTEEEFNKALEENALTLDQLKDNIRKNLTISMMVAESTKDVDVTEDEAKAYYEEHIADYTTAPGANMAHILVPTEKEAKEIKAKYDAGTSFEELAAEYGTDGTKDQGGALGFIEYDSPSYDADFLAGAKTLKEGQVSDPIKTQFGWHLIKVTNVQTEKVTKSFDEVKDQVMATVKEEKSYEQFNKDLDKWKSEMKIETYEDRLA